MSVENGELSIAVQNREDLLIDATVKHWWKRRRFISISIFTLVAVFAAVIVLIPRSYRAQASVIVMPPRFVAQTRAEPLSIVTAKSLLETNELYQQVKLVLQRYRSLLMHLAGNESLTTDKLNHLAQMTAAELSADGQMSVEEAEAIADLELSELRGLFEFTDKELAELTIDGLSRVFYSEESIEKRTAADIIYSPVLQLYAVSDSGDKAQLLVNLWARLFEQKYNELNRGQTQKLFESLEKQQTAGQEELRAVQEETAKFALANNLDLIHRQITDYTNEYTSLDRLLATKQYDLLTLESKISSVNDLLNALNGPGNIWAGSVMLEETTVPGIIRYAPAFPLLVDSGSGEAIGRHRADALSSRDDLIAAYHAATVFHSVNSIEMLEAERQRLKDEYLQEKTQYQQSVIKAEVASQSLAELEQVVKGTSHSIMLYTALPDEILGEAMAADRKGGVERVTSIHLNKEQLNPLWETLVKQRADVSRNVHEAKATMFELAAVLPAKEVELRQLGEKIFQAKQAELLVNLRIERAEKANQQLFSKYLGLKEQVVDLEWDKVMLEDEVKALKESAATSLRAIGTLRNSYESASGQLEILELRKKAALQRAQLLTEKLQESMVAVREDVSDVALASKAVAPSRHFFPPRGLLLAGITLLSSGLLLGGMSRRRFRELVNQ